MRSIAIVFAIALAHSASALATENRFEQVIIDAYRDPRVLQVVETAQRDQRSITVTFDDSQPQAFELGGQTEVSVAADPTTATTEPAVVALAAPSAEEKKSWWSAYTHLGILLDAGVPDGAGASIVFRPWKWLRVHAGGTYNGVSGGIRGGVTLLPPVFFPILPTATVEAGHTFEGDANWIAQKLGSDPAFDNPSLRRVSYDYVNGHLGLELGSQNRFLFYVHGGMSYVHTTVHDFQQTIDQGQPQGSTTITAKDPNVSLLVPSGKIGFIIYFL